MFNYFNPRSVLWRELGEQKALDRMDQIYPAGTTSIAEIHWWLAQGMKWLNQPVPLPEKPITLAAGGKATIPIPIAAAIYSQPGTMARMTVRLLTNDMAKAASLDVKLNGRSLSNGKPNGKWIDLSARPTLLKQGMNELELTIPSTAGDIKVLDAVIEIRHPRGHG
jgi:hypothetical protein